MFKPAVETIFGIGIAMVLAFSTAHAKEITVGVHLPITGMNARVGAGNLEGITTAVKVFNQNNPKLKVKLITIDDEASPAKAVAAVERLAAQGVTALVGGYGSNLIGPASTAAEKAGLVYLTGGSTASALSTRGLKYFFRVNSVYGYAKGISGFVKDLGVKSVSLVHSTKEGPNDTALWVEKGLIKSKIKVTMHPFDSSISDFKPIINKVKVQDRSELLLMIGYENDHVAIIRAAKVLKPNVKAVVGPWSTTTSKMNADFPGLMPNVFGAIMLPHPGSFKTTDGKQFAETYRRLYNSEPDDSIVQLGWVIGQLMCDAIKRADSKGTLEKGGLAAEMRRTDRETILGRVTFDQKGDNPHFMTRMGQNQGDKIPIVWPKEYANAKPIYPSVPW